MDNGTMGSNTKRVSNVKPHKTQMKVNLQSVGMFSCLKNKQVLSHFIIISEITIVALVSQACNCVK